MKQDINKYGQRWCGVWMFSGTICSGFGEISVLFIVAFTETKPAGNKAFKGETAPFVVFGTHRALLKLCLLEVGNFFWEEGRREDVASGTYLLIPPGTFFWARPTDCERGHSADMPASEVDGPWI